MIMTAIFKLYFKLLKKKTFTKETSAQEPLLLLFVILSLAAKDCSGLSKCIITFSRKSVLDKEKLGNYSHLIKRFLTQSIEA